MDVLKNFLKIYSDTNVETQDLKNNQLKPEVFLLGLMKTQLEKSDGRLLQYIIAAVQLFYAHRWKDLTLSTMDEWLVKLTKLADVAKMTLLRER